MQCITYYLLLFVIYQPGSRPAKNLQQLSNAVKLLRLVDKSARQIQSQSHTYYTSCQELPAETDRLTGTSAPFGL